MTFDVSRSAEDERVFYPKAGVEVRYGLIIGACAGAAMFLLDVWLGWFARGTAEAMLYSFLAAPVLTSILYVRYLLDASAKITISPEGVTNTMRSGKSFHIEWKNVTYAHHEVLGGESSYTMKSPGHRIYFTNTGLSSAQWQELRKLVDSCTAETTKDMPHQTTGGRDE